ncbi:receptor protein kinase TMK1 [Cajanus cajan]|uniref:receptor protein kinase TMK1 n=1 Tax=Cajanus cajan TaxID=3821 RepID=UPI00098D8587|nr:receptor protein kinase TMK1 [Cajanus cajan]XP_020215183.1 receptor protein kinase TMK1 [Cajanus cajan]
MMGCVKICIFMFFTVMITMGCYGDTNPNDLQILNDFRKRLKNPEVLKWPENGNDPCGPPSWPYVFCSGGRITQIQTKNLGLKGSLPPNFNQLTELQNLGLQRNNLSGALPSFSGLSKLQYAFLDYNDFDSIPSDFFNGLTNLRVLSLEENPLNATSGWSFPMDLKYSVQLTNLSLVHCNLVGPLPDFLGTLPSLTNLWLSDNKLSGGIPASFAQSSIQVLWLNDQAVGMTGPIDVIASMTFLNQVWLHGNQFTGAIPQNIGNLTSLKELNLNSNQLVGLIPDSLSNMDLQILVLNNNMFMGPVPKFNAAKVSYDSNLFCQSKPGLECAPQVTALLDFLHHLNYPSALATKWSGNDPCGGSWFGLSCDRNSKVSIINLPRQKLNGTLSPSLAKLDSLLEIRLAGNDITGNVPSNFTDLNFLRLLDLSDNNVEPPMPYFRGNVKVVIEGNPLLVNQPVSSPNPMPIASPSPPSSAEPSPQNPSLPPPSSHMQPPSSTHSSSMNQSSSVQLNPQPNVFKRFKTVAIVAGAAIFTLVALMIASLFICCLKKEKASLDAPSSVVVHTKDPSYPEKMTKFLVSDSTTGSSSSKTGISSLTNNSGENERSHVIEAGNIAISIQVLRKVTNNFASENELGRGGFGTVYKGEIEHTTKIAVKRMECGAPSSRALDEFQAEIAVLSKVRHRHLVSLLGYCIEGNERLLVYEYMPLGALSRHLFHWKNLKLEPLSLSQRFTIALDVARAMEYLHNLARQTFIHRDLKSSNILLGDDFRAKVSDFGLVKLAPDGDKSVATKLAGTFGYLAPEYAVMGKITTKVDVFSYGVVLVELLTGLMALDESRPEESRYLVEWFWQIKSCKEALKAAIDPTLEVSEETFESISIVAELAGHCTSREASHRPDMSHVVNVLSTLVEKWRPMDEEPDYNSGIDFSHPLPQLLKVWKESEGKDSSYASEHSEGSIPAKPSGFADSFTSSDAR